MALTAGSEESNDSSVDDSDSDDSIVYEFERAQKKRKTTKTLTDEEKFLLSGHVLGYCLSDDKWGENSNFIPSPEECRSRCRPPPLSRSAKQSGKY